MNQAVAIQEKEFSAPEIRDRVNLIQAVMKSTMIKDTHYGTIPYTPKPTLYKAGAEVLCMTFKIAQEYKIEDLCIKGEARYRVTCSGRHQVTGQVLGEGVGECSSMEEKYAYRAAVCKEEFDATPEANRRVKWSKGKQGAPAYCTNQVKTNTADLANTILKMACKRAMIAMTLNVTAASDIFTQDIEDFPEELRDAIRPTVSNTVAAAAQKAADDAATKVDPAVLEAAKLHLQAMAETGDVAGLGKAWQATAPNIRNAISGMNLGLKERAQAVAEMIEADKAALVEGGDNE